MMAPLVPPEHGEDVVMRRQDVVSNTMVDEWEQHHGGLGSQEVP